MPQEMLAEPAAGISTQQILLLLVEQERFPSSIRDKYMYERTYIMPL